LGVGGIAVTKAECGDQGAGRIGGIFGGRGQRSVGGGRAVVDVADGGREGDGVAAV